MEGKYKPGQHVFLTGGNAHLIKEATVQRYAGGFYTIIFENGGGIKVENPGSTLLARKQSRRS